MEGNDFIFSVMMLPPHRNAIKIEFVNTKKIDISNNYRIRHSSLELIALKYLLGQTCGIWNTK